MRMIGTPEYKLPTPTIGSAAGNIISNVPGTAKKAGSTLADALYDYGTGLNSLYAGAAGNNIAAQWASAEEAMRFSAQEAAKNRQWQEYMSSTAYQRAMADMKKAGLNPILAHSQGGATTPNGATANGYQIAGAQQEVNGNAAMLMAAPAMLSSLEKVFTDGYKILEDSATSKTLRYLKPQAADVIKSIVQSMTGFVGAQKQYYEKNYKLKNVYK